MKSVLLMYTESDGAKADKLQDYLQGRLRKVAELRSIIDILAEKQVFINELRAIDCVLLVGSSQASSLIQNRQQETDENFITFDGKAIHDEFSQNQDLVGKLVIVSSRKEPRMTGSHMKVLMKRECLTCRVARFRKAILHYTSLNIP